MQIANSDLPLTPPFPDVCVSLAASIKTKPTPTKSGKSFSDFPPAKTRVYSIPGEMGVPPPSSSFSLLPTPSSMPPPSLLSQLYLIFLSEVEMGGPHSSTFPQVQSDRHGSSFRTRKEAEGGNKEYRRVTGSFFIPPPHFLNINGDGGSFHPSPESHRIFEFISFSNFETRNSERDFFFLCPNLRSTLRLQKSFLPLRWQCCARAMSHAEKGGKVTSLGRSAGRVPAPQPWAHCAQREKVQLKLERRKNFAFFFARAKVFSLKAGTGFLVFLPLSKNGRGEMRKVEKRTFAHKD